MKPAEDLSLRLAKARLEQVRCLFRQQGLNEHQVLVSVAFGEILSTTPNQFRDALLALQTERVRAEGRGEPVDHPLQEGS